MIQYPSKLDILILSHSSRGVMHGCERKFELSKFYQAPRGGDSLAGDVGTAVHMGYQEWLQTRDMDAAILKLIRSYPMNHGYTDVWNPLDDRSIEACISTLDAIIQAAPMASYEVAYIKDLKGETIPALEVPFEIKLLGAELVDGTPVSFYGYIDCFLFDKMRERYLTVDLKTTRRKIPDHTAVYQFNTQMIPYAMVLAHLVGAEIHSLEMCFLNAYLDLLEPQVIPYNYSKDRRDVQEWMIGVLRDVKIINRSLETGYFRRTEHGCLSFNRPCRFLDYCGERDATRLQAALLYGQDPSEKKYEREEPLVVLELDVREWMELA